MRRLLPAVIAAALLLAGCSGDEAPGQPSAEASASPASSEPGATSTASPDTADLALELRRKLVVPPLPSFTVPTDLLSTDQDRTLAEQLQLEPGLYQGIAVVDARCDDAGTAAPVDGNGTAGPVEAAHFEDGTRTITVTGDGTGVYDAPGLHIAVLAGGAGVYDDGTTRVSVEPDGAGTFSSGDRRYTVRADGSGSYTDDDVRVWVGPDGAGGYDDETLHVTLAADGEVFGDGDETQVAAVSAVLEEGLPLFPPVPTITRVTPSGTSCGSVIRLDANVVFDYDSATLRPDAAALLDRVATLLLALESPPVQVNGYTDQLGEAAYNDALSLQRADAVRAALVERGVPAGSLTAAGLGETHPLRPETLPDGADDPSARQLNRRVELVLLDQ